MELLVFAGIQGSGKTTFYRDRLIATHVRLSLDLLKTRQREAILLHACFAAQQPVVVDNTNATTAQRRRYVQLARAADFRPVLYFFDVSTRVAVARNATRDGKHRVPNVAIFAAQKKLQRPTRAEGFDAIFRVTPGDDTGARPETIPPAPFVVEPWSDEPADQQEQQ